MEKTYYNPCGYGKSRVQMGIYSYMLTLKEEFLNVYVNFVP